MLSDEQRDAARRKARVANAWDDRNAATQALRDSGALRSCSELVEACDVPVDIAAVLVTGRTELLALIEPRVLTKDECAKMYKLIGVLVRTNFALQAHSCEVQQLCEHMEQTIRGVQRAALRTARFAGFHQTNDEELSDEN